MLRIYNKKLNLRDNPASDVLLGAVNSYLVMKKESVSRCVLPKVIVLKYLLVV